MSVRWLVKSRKRWRKKLSRYRINRDRHRRGTSRWRLWNRRVKRAKRRIARRTEQIHRKENLRTRALNEARKDIGVMEVGGNNRGKRVESIVRYIGGVIGAPWCGYAVGTWYKRAGSKAAGTVWGYVYNIAGRGTHKVSKPLPGDIVVYNFGHTGIFEKWVNASSFDAIEGNTGRIGAVSDSATGGDGVYRKRRSRGQVAHFLRVEK